jgi:hypothetical protein
MPLSKRNFGLMGEGAGYIGDVSGEFKLTGW